MITINEILEKLHKSKNEVKAQLTNTPSTSYYYYELTGKLRFIESRIIQLTNSKESK